MIKSLLLQIMPLFVLSFFASCQSVNQENEKKELEKIVAELEQAVSTGDKEPWQKYMAEDGILLNRDGKSNTKQEILAEITPKSQGVSLDIKPVDIKIYLQDASAFISFFADEKLSIHGQTVDTKYPSVMYFEKRNRVWQMVFFSYFEKPVDPKRVYVSKSYLESFAGMYKVSDEMRIEITASDSALVYRKAGTAGTGTLLYPVDEQGHFFRAGTESEFIFTRDSMDHPVLLQRRNWIDLVWTKE